MGKKEKPMTELAELLKGLATDAGGPGEFRYDGGPKPYVSKKTGEPTSTSEKRVEGSKQGKLEKPETQQVVIPQLTPEQQSRVDKLSDEYKSRIQESLESLKGSSFWQGMLENHVSYFENEYKKISKARKLFSANRSLTEDEEYAIEDYVNNSDHIQSFLLGGSKADSVKSSDYGQKEYSKEELNKIVSDISSSINSHSLNKDLKVYRGIDAYGPEDKTYNEEHKDQIEQKKSYLDRLLDLKEGGIVKSIAFNSTSQKREIAKNFIFSEHGVELHINLKKGQNVLPLNSVPDLDIHDQSEVILDRNSKFKVDSVDKKKRIVGLTLLDKGASDSIAIDYTFVSERHPRKKDDFDWEGNQQGGTSASIPQVSIPALSESHSNLVSKIAGDYSKKIKTLAEGYQGLISEYGELPSKNEKSDEEDELADSYRFGYLTHYLPNADIHQLLKEFPEEMNSIKKSQEGTEINDYTGIFINAKELEESLADPDKFGKFTPTAQKIDNRIQQWNKMRIAQQELSLTEDLEKALKEFNKVSIAEHLKEQSDKLETLKENVLTQIEETKADYEDDDEYSQQQIKDVTERGLSILAFDQVAPLDPAQLNAIEEYRRTASDVQGYLAWGSLKGKPGGRPNTKEEKELHQKIENLSDACNSYELNRDMVTYRGTRTLLNEDGTHNKESKEHVEMFLNSTPGDFVSLPSFASVSTQESVAKKFASSKYLDADTGSLETEDGLTLEISLSKGQKALSIPIIDQSDEVSEVLLNINSTYEITNVDKENRRVHLRYLGSE
jgi:hypothetical protein